jgi:hypothetical protein
MRVARRVSVVVGSVVLLLVADLALGMGWGALLGTPGGEDLTRLESGRRVPVFVDDRASTPALADAAWAERLLEDTARTRYEYVPYLYPRVADTDTPYLHSTDGVRRSYLPAGAADGPEIWFFGGSTMWGVGQRDGHTIASEVARVAEAAGLALRVVNFGQQGWSAWQEALAFEQALATRPAPALAVFYDGVNEFEVQLQEGRSADPVPFQAERTAAAVDLAAMAGEGSIDPRPPEEAGAGERAGWAFGSLVGRYRAQSLSGRLLDGLGGLFGADPADAQEGPDEALAADVAGIYGRAQALVDLVAAPAGVEVVSFWQPRTDEPTGYRDVVDDLPDDVVDLTAVLDDVPPEELYLDSFHTNERGARLVAEAMWAELAVLLD